MTGVDLWWLWPDNTLGAVDFLFTASPFVDTWPNWALALLVGLGCGLFWWSRFVSLASPWRVALAGLRAVTAALLVFVALGPAWTLQRAVPGQEAVVLLFDDSRSMRVPDGTGQTRGQRLQRALGDGGWVERLRQTHPVLSFAFGGGIERVDEVGELRFAALVSDLPGAVARALARTAPAPVAAVVLFSDGVQQDGVGLGTRLAGLPEGTKLFTVGVGSQKPARSLALQAVRVEHRRGDGVVEVEGTLRAVGQGGERLVLEITEAGRPLAAAKVEARAGQEEYAIKVRWAPGGSDLRAYRAQVRLQDRAPLDAAYDAVAEDNNRGFILDLRDKSYRILYFAGRPGWEFKFVRRALADDPQLELGGLVRVSGAERRFVFGSSAASLANPLFEGFEADAAAPRYDESVFMRLGLRQGELEKGYPRRAEDLFPFHLVVWDAVEADFFAADQLQLSRDFVERRGGSLLMLGGRHLAGYIGSPLENILPVVLQEGFIPGPLRPQATIEGFLNGIWAFDGMGPRRNSASWAALPPLAAANRFALARAGAEVLARVGTGRPFFAWQRYGEGRSAVLGSNDTWRWRMGREAGDGAQARFWRRLARSLVESVPERAHLLQAERLRLVGVADTLNFKLRDERFAPAVGRSVEVEVEGPTTGRRRLPVEESLEEPGTYRVPFRPEEAGLQRLFVSERLPDGNGGMLLETAVLAEADRREMVDADYNPAYLAEMARQGGGAFVSLSALDGLPERIPLRPVYSEEVEHFGLWQMPWVYVLLAALLLGEWICRRRRGLP